MTILEKSQLFHLTIVLGTYLIVLGTYLIVLDTYLIQNSTVYKLSLAQCIGKGIEIYVLK